MLSSSALMLHHIGYDATWSSTDERPVDCSCHPDTIPPIISPPPPHPFPRSLHSFANALETGLAEVMAEGKVRTPDMGGTNSTTDMAEAVLQQAEKHRE